MKPADVLNELKLEEDEIFGSGPVDMADLAIAESCSFP
jgi:hypothetical protein